MPQEQDKNIQSSKMINNKHVRALVPTNIPEFNNVHARPKTVEVHSKIQLNNYQTH